MKRKYTLEEHLRNVSKNHDTNHSLESVYDLQKRKLTRYLSSVVTTYPTYSTHDTWHSANIVSAIENILGKDRIKKLTGIDTFLILMCSYMHDIGMLYTEQEVRDLWKTQEFQTLLEEYQSDNSPIGKAAKLLLDVKEKVAEEVTWPLDIKQAITVVLMEYFRPQHGKRIKKLTDKANQIGELLCVEDSFLPSRIIKIINKISMSHTGSFENMLDELVMVDTFAGEEFHPRLVAWLLRIGDLCDLDNDRFNKIGIATFGTLQDDNLAHYFKHCSVETLYISCDKIQIIANIDRKSLEKECATEWMKDDARSNNDKFRRRCMDVYQQTIREHVNWKSWMENEINSAKLNVNMIFPKQWNRKIPEIEYRILLNGKEISSGNQNLRFLFSQEKAYSLIENISIYQNKGLIFLRELIQNAIDASKIQIWREIKERIPEYKMEVSPFQVDRLFPGIFEKYTIQISLKYHAETDSVDFSIEDSGIGISVQEFQEHILKTGNSWKNRKKYKKEFENMPAWLKPTGAFGIGLHTVFTVTDEMKIYTKSDQEEQTNEMILYSGKKSGYAFCQSAETERARGTKISFTFRLSEAQKAQCFTQTEDSYLNAYDSEYENIAINHINEYCKTPIVPICFNGERLLDELVSSGWCNELKNFNGKYFEGDIAVESRFEYCFGENFQKIIVYDKKIRSLIRLGISLYQEQDIDSLSYCMCEQDEVISFMGMHIEDTIDIRGNFLKIEYMDILAGEGDGVIDAARMTFTYDAKIKTQTALEDVVLFARKCYLELMKAQRQDKEVQIYRDWVKTLAHEYYAGEITMKDVWIKICRKKQELFPANARVMIRSLEVRILSYLMCLNFVDEILKIDIKNYKTNKENKYDIKAFAFLDYLLKKWKADWRTSTRYFKQPYFDNQMLEILNHYCCIWGHMIIQFVLGNRRIEGQEKKWEMIIKKWFYRLFPNMCKWKKARHIFQDVVDMLITYRGKLGNTHTYISVLDAVLFPGSAVVFREWRYRGIYADNSMMSLEIGKPYLYLLLDIPQKGEWSRLERDIWNLYIRNSIYGAFRYDMLFPDAVEKLIDEKYVINKLWENKLTYDCIPILEKYEITELEMCNQKLKARVDAVETGSRGIRAAKNEKWEVYRSFWEWINNMQYAGMDESYVKVPGFDEYREICEFEMGNHPYLGIRGRFALVPAWDYLGNIREFINECDLNQWNAKRCLDEIINRDLDSKVIDYLCKQKTNGSENERKRIQILYRKFLLELFTVWDEVMPKG